MVEEVVGEEVVGEEVVGYGGVIGGAAAVVDVLTLLVIIAVVLFERDEGVALEETFKGDQGEVPFERFERFALDVALLKPAPISCKRCVR